MAIWFTASFAFSGDEVSPLKGEYKEIKAIRESKAIKVFLEGTDEQKEKVASRIQEHPNRYAPAVFFHLSVYLYAQDEVDDALFWLYCARILTYFDIQRCTDRSVEGAGEILNNLVPQLLRLEQFQDLENSKQIMKNAVQWVGKETDECNQRKAARRLRRNTPISPIAFSTISSDEAFENDFYLFSGYDRDSEFVGHLKCSFAMDQDRLTCLDRNRFSAVKFHFLNGLRPNRGYVEPHILLRFRDLDQSETTSAADISRSSDTGVGSFDGFHRKDGSIPNRDALPNV